MRAFAQRGTPRLSVFGAFVAGGVLVGMVSGCSSVRTHGVGPLYQPGETPHREAGYSALGPVLEQRRAAEGKRFRAVRPFWSHAQDETGRRVTDILWPLGMFKTRNDELDWRLLPAFGHDFSVEQSPSRHRWSVFPLLFGGRSMDGQRYFALFPIGGTLHEFLGYDRIWFVAFPFWSASEKGENRTTSVLWPVYSHTRGGDISRWRLWPFYGYSHTPDRWTKRFVLWPFWTSVAYHYPNQPGGGFVLFPIYGQVNVADRHSRMFIPPFFKVAWTGTGYRAIDAPWPFFQYVRGEDENRLYVFPLAGRRRIGQDQTWFVLWPLISGRKTERSDTVLTRFRIMPFWQQERVVAKAKDEPHAKAGQETLSRYFRLWPLVLYRQEGQSSLLRAPALWPLKRTPGIERNWAPLWTLYRHETVEDRKDTQWMWGLVRRVVDGSKRKLSVFPVYQSRKDPARRTGSWQLLYGLFGYHKDGLQREVQLLYFMRMKRTVTDKAEDPAQREEP